MKIMKNIVKKILLIAVGIYIISIFISQQQLLNTYQKETKESLVAMKDNVNSPEYIEEIAREKLGMYLPNERVYIDIGK